MRLIEELERQLAVEESYFQRHLITEDVRRLELLRELALAQSDVEAFVVAGSKAGWTPEDRRTHELRETLDPFLRAVHAAIQARSQQADAEAQVEALDAGIMGCWQAFATHRMDRLVGCLARVPRPTMA